MKDQIILNNRYHLEEQKGAGGMAMVYRAHDQMLERTVAIKILRKDFSDNPEFRDRFRQEAKAAANLSHPNIVTVHDFGLDDEILFIVMEYVPGTNLKSIMKQRGRFPLDEFMNLISQACAGIGYAHRSGVVHCDVKPQNMLVTPDKRLKVVDFGIARALATIKPDEQAEIVWGSPNYFSPEQASGIAPSPSTDVYALGVVMFELITGQLPFKADTPQELARLHREALPPSPRKINPDIPYQLEQIILKALSKEPSSRYRTAGQLGRILYTFNQQIMDKTPDSIDYSGRSTSAIPTSPLSEQIPLRTDANHVATGLQKPPQQATSPDGIPYITPTEETETSIGIDWLTWILGLFALIALGGLIPFWLWVYYLLNPPL